MVINSNSIQIQDDCTELANITMPTNPHETGNLKKNSNCKN